MRTRRDVFVGDIVDQLLSDGFMQPGRGIDDSSGASGAVEIFFSACSTDQEVDRGVGSTRARSVAQAAIDATIGNQNRVLVYGSRAPMHLLWGNGRIRYIDDDHHNGTGEDRSVMTRYTFDPDRFADEGIVFEYIDGVVHDRRAA